MNKASCMITHLFKRYCNAGKIAKITGNGFFANLIRNFKADFGSYLSHYYHVRILSYSTLTQAMKQKPDSAHDPNDLYVCRSDSYKHRPVKESDAGAIKSIIRKWYQSSDEINLRIILLLNSKAGSRYIARKTGVPRSIISRVRHGRTPINEVNVGYRLNLENLYLNSRLAQRIASVRVKI